jgi:hypothetical protein
MLQLVWLTLLAVHAGAAGVWWWLGPHGVVPLFVVVLFLTALVARGRLSAVLLPPVLAMIPLFWMAFGISSRLVFFESFRSLWNLPFLAGAALAGLWVKQFRRRLVRAWVVPIFAVAAAIAGWIFPGTQRAPDPATTPLGAPLGDVPAGTPDRKLIKLSKDAQLHPIDGRVVIRRDKMVLNVQSMLSFANRSPDRCWIALAPPELNVATVRTFVTKVHDGARWTLWYKDEDMSVVDVTTRDGGVQLDARSRLARPVFAHVDTFGELTLQGHHKLTLSFSPVPKERVEVAPVTTAARFAYVDASGTFHLAQASQLTRGPFSEIASGPLPRGEPLVITIYDDGKPMFTVALDDWAAQASTQPSPTAGEGIPVNAIEFVRGGEAESSAALISLTLADTSIGRGTQTVGHAAGVYRNRISVRLP